MDKATVGTSVYVYSLDSNGNVIERKATIARRKTAEKYMVVRLYGGQMMCLPKNPRTIIKDAMWSDVSQKAVYVEKMTDILYDRMELYRDKLQTVTKKMKNMRACV